MDANTNILILGAGTIGLSTAYHLAKAGYKNVTVLEKSACIPADLSAGNDFNKIVRAEYEEPFYTELALKSIEAWQTPLFAPFFRKVGYLIGNSSTAPEKSRRTLEKSLSTIASQPAYKNKVSLFKSREDIRAIAPVFDGPMKWQGYFNQHAGYAKAGDALIAVYSACCTLGVKFYLGDAVESVTYDGDRCTGAKTASGRTHAADITVFALGANLATVLPQIGKQVVAKAWPVGHIQLTAKEAEPLQGIPVTYARDLGFFFEPDRRTNILKLCPAVAGYTNWKSDGLSIPVSTDDWIPPTDEARIRKLLRETLPALADRPLINKKICWCADTEDSNMIIDHVPGKKNLVVAGGDCGHCFKFLPIIGEWVKDMLEKGQQTEGRWRWKDGQQGGGDVSWRVGETKDLKEFRAKL
ncbi:uncharacterized protein E0L32_005920 [Thyridium curvatum]|uniref:FAD dependent oxidoreductase domain-containing protein n=1 Tax=Thyridium curvatum TaxID=1093900 RepID=A0A507B1Y1_9PEZI|nr:uncharacterized protein E0L32_005920 [Thyridium curvatum]TPX13717.1 hypothetical protein E0L32_005920 [Thyridium curvatum]